jgi:hypothetical protein
MNAAVSALRFCYWRTLDRPVPTWKLHRVKYPHALPTVLSREKVAGMLVRPATSSIKRSCPLPMSRLDVRRSSPGYRSQYD